MPDRPLRHARLDRASVEKREFGCKLVLFKLYLQPKRRVMAQTAFTVRMDADVKKRFDELCKDFGMSSNTAFNMFARAGIQSERIPFDVESEERALIERARRVTEQIRAQAALNGTADMTLEEINEEIRKAREERRARQQKSED